MRCRCPLLMFGRGLNEGQEEPMAGSVIALQLFWVILNRQNKRQIWYLDSLGNPILGNTRYPESLSDPPHGLMMKTIHADMLHTQNIRQKRPRLSIHFVSNVCARLALLFVVKGTR